MRVWWGRCVVVSVPLGAGWLPPHMYGVACCAVSDRLSFDAIFLRHKEETNEGGGGAGGRGSFGVLVGLSSHKKLNVEKGEWGGDGVCLSRAVFTGSEEEEECDLGKVCNFLVYWRSAFSN